METENYSLPVTALWEDLGKQADIILHNHLQPPP